MWSDTTIRYAPAHWQVTRLKYVAEVNPETLPETTNPERVITYIDIGNVNSCGHIGAGRDVAFGEAPSRARRVVRAGDTLFSTVRSYLRAIAHVPDAMDGAVASTGFAVLRPRPGVVPGFLHMLVRSSEFVSTVAAVARGVGYPAIGPAMLSMVPVALPPMAEQEALYMLACQHIAKLDAVLDLIERMGEVLQEQRRAVIVQTLASQQRYAGCTDKQVDCVVWPVVPQHWQCVPVSRLFHVSRGRVVSMRDIENNSGPYPVYSSQTEDNGVLGYIDTYDFDEELLTWTTDGANAGTVFYRAGKGTCTNVCGMLRPVHKPCHLKFFSYVLHVVAPHHVRADINPKLMSGAMARIRIPVPPYEEQCVLAATIEQRIQAIDAARSRLGTLVDLVYEKRQMVYSLATRGNRRAFVQSV